MGCPKMVLKGNLSEMISNWKISIGYEDNQIMTATNKVKPNMSTLLSNSLIVPLNSNNIANHPFQALVNSGSTHCFIDTHFTTKHKLQTVIETSEVIYITIADHSKTPRSVAHRHTTTRACRIRQYIVYTLPPNAPQAERTTRSTIETHISSSRTHICTLLDQMTPLYYITGYPMVSHHTPTYFHSGDITYIRRSESMRIYHANVPATNRTPTISLLSTHSLAMPVVSSHSTSVIIH